MPSAPVSRLPLLWAARFIRSNRNSWSAAAVPTAIALTLSLVFGFLAIDVLSPWLADTLAPTGDSWRFVWHIVRWASVAMGCYAGVIASLVLTPALSGPALERLVRLTEEKLGVPPRPSQGFWSEMLCGLRAQLFLVAITLPLTSALSLIGWLLPWLSPVVLLIQALVLGVAVAWNLLDYPMTLRGIPPRERWALARRNLGTILAFGLPFAALFWIPCLGIALLPVGVVAATRVLWSKLVEDPQVAKLLQFEPQ